MCFSSTLVSLQKGLGSFAICIFLLFALEFVACSEIEGNVHLIYPPEIDAVSSQLVLNKSSVILLKCRGRHPLHWSFPNDRLKNRYEIGESVDAHNVGDRPFLSTLTIQEAIYNDTGLYWCFYDGTSKPYAKAYENASSIYVFAYDEDHLFATNDGNGLIVQPVHQHKETVIPCRPTHPDVNVTMWKASRPRVQVSLGIGVEFDPTRGFLLKYADSFFHGLFYCYANSDNSSANLTLALSWFRMYIIFFYFKLWIPELHFHLRGSIVYW